MSNELTNPAPVAGAEMKSGKEESFAEMLEKSFTSAGRLDPGKKIRTKVIGIAGDLVYVDLGGKSDGVIELSEFKDEQGAVKVNVGDEIEVFFISVKDGVKRLTTLISGYSPAILSSIDDAFKAGIPVTGEVKREIKGGFEVSLGGIRSFCPFSQIDLSGGREGGIYLGQSFPFRILEYGERGRNIVVSRRALLEEEKKGRILQLKESLQTGMEITGTVKSLHNFGAFVDLGGIDGMIPLSEMSWSRADKPQDIVTPGEKATVKIIAIDWDRERITLSIKALQPDPWASVAAKYIPDNQVTGTIVRLAPFGAFVNLEPGIDGLIHISNFGAGKRIKHPKEVVQIGQQVEAYIFAVDPQNRKISLSLQPRPKPKEIVLPKVGELLEGKVEKVMSYGVFVRISEDVTGLVPNAEMSTPVGTDHTKMFPAGTSMKVVVIDTDAKTGKVRLSRKSVDKKIEKEEYLQYKESVKKEENKSSEGLGTLGRLLKEQMEKKGISSL